MLFTVTAVVAGLVAITPAAGYVGPMGSIAIGLAAGIVCAWAVGLKYKAGYDDALDVVGVHAVGGMLGALLIGGILPGVLMGLALMVQSHFFAVKYDFQMASKRSGRAETWRSASRRAVTRRTSSWR